MAGKAKPRVDVLLDPGDFDRYGHLTFSKYPKYFTGKEIGGLEEASIGDKPNYENYYLAIVRMDYRNEVIQDTPITIETDVKESLGIVTVIEDGEKNTGSKAVIFRSRMFSGNVMNARRLATYCIAYPDRTLPGIVEKIEDIHESRKSEYQTVIDGANCINGVLADEMYEQLFGEGFLELLEKHSLLPKDLLPDFGFVVVTASYTYFGQIKEGNAVTVTSGFDEIELLETVPLFKSRSILRANGEVMGIAEITACFVQINEDKTKKLIRKPDRELVRKIRGIDYIE